MNLSRPSIEKKPKNKNNTLKKSKKKKKSQSRALIFPKELKQMPPFLVWIRIVISHAIKDGEEIDKDTLQMSMPPTLTTRSYRLIYIFENHNRVSSVEEHLTLDNNVVATFEHECISRPNDYRLMLAKLEYIRWVEKSLELNYGDLKTIVLLCNWVKVNYNGNSATMKRDKYDFTLVNFCILNSHIKLIFLLSHCM